MSRLRKDPERRQLIKDRKARKHSDCNRTVVNVDPDIDRENIISPTIRSLLDEYTSVIPADKNQECIHFFPDEYSFLTLHDANTAFPACYEDMEWYKCLDETLLFVPVVKALYVCEIWRRRGRQTSILDKITSIADGHNEVLLAFSSPFVLKREYKAKTGWEAFKTFQNDGENKGPDFDTQLVKQKERLRKSGFINVGFEWHELTTHGDAWVYMPSGVSNNTRKIIESRIIEN